MWEVWDVPIPFSNSPMGIFAVLIFTWTAWVLGRHMLRKTPDRPELPPQASGRPMGEDARRLGSAVSGLNESLPFLGGQPGFSVPPPPDTREFVDDDDPYTERVEAPPQLVPMPALSQPVEPEDQG